MSTGKVIALVATREILERGRTWSFRILTLALLVLAAGAIIAVNAAPDVVGDDDAVTLAVVSATATPPEDTITRAAADLGLDFEVFPYGDRMAAEAALREGRVGAVLAGDDLVFESSADERVEAVVNRARYVAQLPALLDALGITAEDAGRLLDPPRARIVILEVSPPSDESERAVAALATIVLYLTLALYGSWILMGVAEEKSSRVVEVLLGLIRPRQLLAGKTLGILTAAAIQVVAAGAGVLLGLALTGGVDLPDVTFNVAAVAAVFLLLGLALYSLMYAAVGATVSRAAEAQSAAMPVAVLLLAPYLLSVTYVPEAPDSAFSVALSLFPATSPLIMPTRLALGTPSALEIAVSLLLLPPAVALVAWLGGRVYARSILGARRVGLAGMFRAMRG